MQVMVEWCQRVLNGLGRPDEWKISIVVHKGKGNIMSVIFYRNVKLHEHGVLVEKCWKKHSKMEKVNKMQLGFKHEKATIDAVFI